MDGSIISLQTGTKAADPQWEIGLLIALAVGFIVYRLLTYVAARLRSTQPHLSAIDRHFRNVFAIMDEPRRQSLVSYYMQKYECGREQAMRHAIEDRERDQRRYS
ncbi:hypothetical protein [Pseudorhizobium flavum]|uniref:hypothetical protein n=1 Tax=Pseudorhizobium flavum TaxID=1335061 RepID=UPI00376FA438